MLFDSRDEDLKIASEQLAQINDGLRAFSEGMKAATVEASTKLQIHDSSVRVKQLEQIVHEQMVPLVSRLASVFEDHSAVFGHRARIGIAQEASTLNSTDEISHDELEQMFNDMAKFRASIVTARENHAPLRNTYARELSGDQFDETAKHELARLVSAIDAIDRQMVDVDQFAKVHCDEVRRKQSR